jgi:hypothetical protein
MLPDGSSLAVGRYFWTRGGGGDAPMLVQVKQVKTLTSPYPYVAKVYKNPLDAASWYHAEYDPSGVYLLGEESCLDLMRSATQEEAEELFNPYSKPNPVEMAVSIEPEDWEQPFVRGGE